MGGCILGVAEVFEFDESSTGNALPHLRRFQQPPRSGATLDNRAAYRPWGADQVVVEVERAKAPKLASSDDQPELNMALAELHRDGTPWTTRAALAVVVFAVQV